MPADFATADLMDDHPEAQVTLPGLVGYGSISAFAGPIETVIAPEDNTLVRTTLESPGNGRVLVVDGLGSLRCALVGDNIAALAIDNGWAGVIVNGCIRDLAVINKMAVGIKALGTTPRKSVKRDQGNVGEAVSFMGVTFTPGAWLYADEDGVVVTEADVRRHGS